MGLDIYLKSRAMMAADDAYNAAWEAWNEGDPTPKSETIPEDIPGKSELHPDNINEPGYLRSSYNSGGFNSAVPRYLKDQNTSYYSIFAPIIGDDPEPYHMRITDVTLVRRVQERARDVARRLRAMDAPLTTIRVGSFGTSGTFDNEIDAITWVEEQLNREGNGGLGDWAYTCREGYVDPKGTGPVYAVVMVKGFAAVEPHLVVRAETDGESWTKSYADSAEVIAEEFCEQMIRLIERDGECHMTWSG
jgi:hypothetical protein